MKSIPEMYKNALAKPERLRTDQEKAIIRAYELRKKATQEASDQLPKPEPQAEPYIPVKHEKSAREIIRTALSKPEHERTEAEKMTIAAYERAKQAALKKLK